MPFVYEAMGYMPQNFTSVNLLEITSNLIRTAEAQVTLEQAKSAVQGYIHVVSRGMMKSNPYPLTYTGKKNKQHQKIYQRTVVVSKT